MVSTAYILDGLLHQIPQAARHLGFRRVRELRGSLSNRSGARARFFDFLFSLLCCCLNFYMSSQPRRTKWKKRVGVPRTYIPRPRLTGEDIRTLATKMRLAYRWEFDPQLFQLEAVKAQLEGVDMIVQAPTGAGKTAIAAGPHVWPGSVKRFTIMVCPLLLLEEEMVREIPLCTAHESSHESAIDRRRPLRQTSN